jgi:hypothetical protein
MEGYLMAKIEPGIMVSLDLSFSHIHGGGDSTHKNLRAHKYIYDVVDKHKHGNDVLTQT